MLGTVFLDAFGAVGSFTPATPPRRAWSGCLPNDGDAAAGVMDDVSAVCFG